MVIYADTSFVLPLYRSELHSAQAMKWYRGRGEIILPLSPLLEVEIRNALALQVFQQKLTKSKSEQIWGNFQRDVDEGFWQRIEVDFHEVARQAMRMAARHSITLGSRSLDILQVGYALVLQTEFFWTFDLRQARLAEAEGLIVRAKE